MAFKRSGVRLPLSPPAKGTASAVPFCCVGIRGREALCKMSESKRAFYFAAAKAAESILPSPSEARRRMGCGFRLPAALARRSPPAKGTAKAVLFCCVGIRGREALCKMPESKRAFYFAAAKAAESILPSPSEARRRMGCGFRLPAALARRSPPAKRTANAVLFCSLKIKELKAPRKPYAGAL